MASSSNHGVERILFYLQPKESSFQIQSVTLPERSTWLWMLCVKQTPFFTPKILIFRHFCWIAKELPEIWHCHPLSLDVLPEPLRCQAASKTFTRRRMAKVPWIVNLPCRRWTLSHWRPVKQLMPRKFGFFFGHPEIAHFCLTSWIQKGLLFSKAFCIVDFDE